MKLSTKRVIRSRDVKWLNKTFKEYQESEGLYKDDEEDDLESDYSSGSEDENESNEPTETRPAVSLLRTTRSGIQFAPEDEIIPDKQDGNVKVMQEMKKLSGFFNPEASEVVEKERTIEEPTNAAILQQNSLEAAVEGDELEKDATSVAINHLFGDLAFFCRDSFLQEPDVALYSDSVE